MEKNLEKKQGSYTAVGTVLSFFSGFFKGQLMKVCLLRGVLSAVDPGRSTLGAGRTRRTRCDPLMDWSLLLASCDPADSSDRGIGLSVSWTEACP